MSLKLALIGDGKVGSKFAELVAQTLGNKYAPLTIFNENHLPTLDNLRGHDAIVSFVPGHAFIELIPLLLSSKIPVVTGSTGFTWQQDVLEKIKNNQCKWIHGTNFSLGMSLIHKMIQVLSNTPKLFNDYRALIHEIHHIHKKDAPSGTALSWKNWLNLPCEVTSERAGEVIGFHQLTLTAPNEKIILTHEATDRKIFAQGALWAVEQVLNNKNIPDGLNRFEDITTSLLL
ncbi:MAG: dihydrodipicolinate reductase C-terminal domain-containing protein [Pseudomonadota bacterium]